MKEKLLEIYDLEAYGGSSSSSSGGSSSSSSSRDEKKAAEKAQKAAEKAQKEASKAAEKAQKEASKAAEKAAEKAEKEKKEASKAAEKAQKEASKAAEKAQKEATEKAEKVQKEAIKAAEKAAEKAEKEKKEAAKAAEVAAEKAKKEEKAAIEQVQKTLGLSKEDATAVYNAGKAADKFAENMSAQIASGIITGEGLNASLSTWGVNNKPSSSLTVPGTSTVLQGKVPNDESYKMKNDFYGNVTKTSVEGGFTATNTENGTQVKVTVQIGKESGLSTGTDGTAYSNAKGPIGLSTDTNRSSQLTGSTGGVTTGIQINSDRSYQTIFQTEQTIFPGVKVKETITGAKRNVK